MMKRAAFLLSFLLIALFSLNCQAEVQSEGPQSPIKSETVHPSKYPRIVLYSVSWCPHCKEVKEYLTSHNIPFINRDVEMDNSARTELLERYKIDAVPVIVLGNDEKIIKGFNRGNFEKVLKEMEKKGGK